jgi:VIT1/CCC1 family predicted Fe2+/Mn2+ transporter
METRAAGPKAPDLESRWPRLTKLSYGGTAAIVTGMGLVVAFDGGTSSKAALVSSLLVVAIADNLADSLAIHVYQESENLPSRSAFRSTVANYLTRLMVAGSFVILALLTPAHSLVPVVLVWGMALLCTLTYFVARGRGAAPGLEVLKHLAVALLVILVSKAIGAWIVARASM